MNREIDILLVEDNDADAELSLRAFRRQHLDVRVRRSRDGLDALAYLRRQGAYAGRIGRQPRLVLLDIRMPFISGIEVLQQIRTDQALRTLPVVMMTSSDEARDVEAAYRLGANSYVVKPLRFHDFMRAAEEVGVYWARLNEAVET
ncbi:MAG TPA: response regulator [Burkholderiales bacterium]|nr:response regulator [Burkholderiales bacterium]